MKIGIYRIINPKGKIYVGQSFKIEKRWKKYYKMDCEQQIKLFRSFVKYGVENHKFEIIEECSIEQLDERELFWGNFYNVLGENGLNLRLGLGRGLVSEETKIKMGKAHKGHECYKNPKRGKKISESLQKSGGTKGQKQSQETCNKKSKSMLGKSKPEGFGEMVSKRNKGKNTCKRSNETKQKMSENRKGHSMYNEDWKQKISESLKGRKISEEIKNKISLSNTKKPIRCIETNIDFINKNHASKEMNISPTMIRKSCEFSIKVKNYTFTYLQK